MKKAVTCIAGSLSVIVLLSWTVFAQVWEDPMTGSYGGLPVETSNLVRGASAAVTSWNHWDGGAFYELGSVQSMSGTASYTVKGVEMIEVGIFTDHSTFVTSSLDGEYDWGVLSAATGLNPEKYDLFFCPGNGRAYVQLPSGPHQLVSTRLGYDFAAVAQIPDNAVDYGVNVYAYKGSHNAGLLSRTRVDSETQVLYAGGVPCQYYERFRFRVNGSGYDRFVVEINGTNAVYTLSGNIGETFDRSQMTKLASVTFHGEQLQWGDGSGESQEEPPVSSSSSESSYSSEEESSSWSDGIPPVEEESSSSSGSGSSPESEEGPDPNGYLPSESTESNEGPGDYISTPDYLENPNSLYDTNSVSAKSTRMRSSGQVVTGRTVFPSSKSEAEEQQEVTEPQAYKTSSGGQAKFEGVVAVGGAGKGNQSVKSHAANEALLSERSENVNEPGDIAVSHMIQNPDSSSRMITTLYILAATGGMFWLALRPDKKRETAETLTELSGTQAGKEPGA